MKNGFRRIAGYVAVAAAAIAPLAAQADSTWELVSLKPFPISVGQPSAWQESSFESLYQAGGGFAAEGREDDQPVATEPTQGAAAFRLVHASWGFGVSEMRSDFDLGEYCTDFPAGEIDWDATKTAITNSAAYKDGYIFYVDSATNDEGRVLFTRGGEVTVPWKLAGGADAAQAYTVGQTTMARPYRIFWTEYPFNGPKIDLSAHPHVRLLGDPAIVKPLYEATATSAQTGVSNLVRGVVFDSSANVLRCYCRVIDEATRKYDGPEGQFVLAYYDSGSKDNLVATIVVEACNPDVTTIKASVGEELRPTGGGYDVEGLESRISQGDAAVTGDKASPYVYKHTGKTNWSPKHNSVFAISPTDATTTKTGESAPWRADIYWMSPDPLDILWPFEEDWYEISWPESAPAFIVSGNALEPGLPIIAPTNYTTSVCDYQAPANIATASNDGCVSAQEAGWFTLKVTADDNIWFQPFRAVLRTDPAYALTNAAPWTVGHEIRPLGGAAAANTADAVMDADGNLPGYIYAVVGGGNWNPRLYHEPKQDSLTDGVDTADDDKDPFEDLKSAIYPVNTSHAPIEVWWQSSVMQEGMEMPIRFPCVVQRYAVEWPREKDVQNIVIAAQRGSDGQMSGASEAAIYLNATTDRATPTSVEGIKPGLDSGLTFGFWVNPSPSGAGYPETTEGLLVTLSPDYGNKALSFRLRKSNGKHVVALSRTTDAGASWTDVASAEVPSDEWTFVSLVLDPTGGASRAARFCVDAREAWTGTVSLEVLFHEFSFDIGAWRPLFGGSGIPAAAGVALDSISVWSAPLTVEQLAETWQKMDGASAFDIARQLHYSFDEAGDLDPLTGLESRFAFDTVGCRRLLSIGPLKLSPGAPHLYSGLVETGGQVAPEVYWRNDPNAVGFNPNDEHAFLADSPTGGKIVHALRCDLASEYGSRPFVLVQYEKGGKGAMRVYGVQLTNAVYSTLGSTRTAGLMLTPPHPLDGLDDASNDKNFALSVSAAPTNSFGEVTSDSEVVYYDHFKRMWARRNGDADAYYYYAVQDGFWFPDVASQPAAGTLVPWLARAATNKADVLTSAPMPWRWNVTWPDDETVPTMRVAQTLTKADSGLPEVWSASSMAVVFPAPEQSKLARERVVHLIDPTVERSQPLAVAKSFPDEYGFTLGAAGTTQLKTGKYYFTGLPPSISDRFYVDAANQKMCLVGQYVEKASGGSYLQLNVLDPSERAALRGVCKATGDALTRWQTAVDALATAEVQPNTTSRRAIAVPKSGTNGVSNVETAYTPVDHYALVASGEGVGYVTLIENDCSNTTMVAEGSTVSMHVVKVVPELYAGGLTVIVDPMNKLSEQLTVAYTSPFGAAADDFEFEWRRIETQADGSVPTNYPDWRIYGDVAAAGRTAILLGAAGADLKDLQNMYYALRYRAKAGATAHDVTGDTWSDWCGPTLAEGWVQRVLNSVTPFAQRCADFSSYTSDIGYSMLEQIGAPYHGDVALNNDNLNNIGLLELYRTVLNKAESMSLALGAKTDAGVNKQLLLAASRIAELYGILGDEAYSDAKNPTIGQVFTGTEYDSDSLNASVFCFQNQLPTLLDEELALLRGRTSAVAPNMKTYPYYNRLIWNFTKGVTQGEVAYVNNYMIRGADGQITVEEAAKQYPQGHGDAYGHYLSMLKSFYHLARNPYFDWYASMTEMLVGDSVVNVDYFDEEKFAEAAGKLAKTALDTIDLTARKAWKDAAGVVGAGYFDADEEQAFGYGEWATRGGYGALCNWAVVNALLPTNGTPANAVFEDKGIKRINRATASSLAYLPSVVADIQRKLDALDSGMNPLGLSDNAIPFDIEPSSTSHFEQMRARAEKALQNAKTVLDFAKQFGSRLALIALQEAAAVESHENTEFEYNKKLIAIYGTPLEGDIGPGGIYQQGYNGPDIYHYMYIDLSPYGLKSVDSALSKTFVKYKLGDNDPVAQVINLEYEEKSTITVSYTLTPDGIPQAKSDLGTRYKEGSIQAAYRDFLAAYVSVKQKMGSYDKAKTRLETECDIAKTKLRMAGADLTFDEIINAYKDYKAVVDYSTSMVLNALDFSKDKVESVAKLAYESGPKIIGAGLTINTDPSAIVGAVSGAAKNAATTILGAAIYGAKTTKLTHALAGSLLENTLKMVRDGFDFYNAEVSSWERLKNAIDNVSTAANNLQNAYVALVAAEQAYRAKIAEGDTIREELAMTRRHWANEATRIRYADMYDRIQRNNALTKYTTAFDTAQRYVYMLAKVYDYETGLLSSDPYAGDSFMRNVIAARAIGEKDIATDQNSTLWDAVTRMSANWDVLKGRLGINNPETTTKWFSLRYSLFRIKPGAEGDAAWRAALLAHWRDDIFSDPEIARYCQPPQNDATPLAAEPGLVITFPTAINLAENFFGKPLLGGETTYSSSDYAVKLASAGLRFVGYDGLAVQTPSGLAVDPNVYLVPVGLDYMRAPAGTTRQTLAFRVIDQVMPLPYESGDVAGLLGDPDWIVTLSAGDEAATIRRHSTMAVCGGNDVSSTRLVGRSVWNDRWLLVIPASSLSSDRVNALKTFIYGLDTDKDGQVDVPGVSDIEIGIKAYSRSGN